MKNLNRYIDHTLLKPEATEEQITKLCQEAIHHHFFSVCVNPHNVKIAYDLVKNTDVCVCTVVGFPLGATTTATKVFETHNAISLGASEVDMVINIGAIKSSNWNLVENDIRAVKEVCKDKILKVIFETCLLTNDEIVMSAQVAERAGADYIKTSTGFSTNGATLEVVELMKKSVSHKIKVKASGGVKDLKTAKAMIEKGASRLGTSSGVAIINGLTSDAGY